MRRFSRGKQGRKTIPVTPVDTNEEALVDLDRRLYAEATPERLAQERFIREHQDVLIDATHKPTGWRAKFLAVEHFNVGPGWMMLSVDPRIIPGVIPDSDLENLVPTDTPATSRR